MCKNRVDSRESGAWGKSFTWRPGGSSTSDGTGQWGPGEGTRTRSEAPHEQWSGGVTKTLALRRLTSGQKEDRRTEGKPRGGVPGALG